MNDVQIVNTEIGALQQAEQGAAILGVPFEAGDGLGEPLHLVERIRGDQQPSEPVGDPGRRAKLFWLVRGPGWWSGVEWVLSVRSCVAGVCGPRCDHVV